MKSVPKSRFSPRASKQINIIWRYIAQHSRQAANGVLRRIHEAVRLAAENPGMGARREDISPGARTS
ncbi:type II toxin-antitoxin system RelE/ParE family toxin [Devosia sp. Leaf420]|uniref:type II toxin-antitoxin system RelE/ParE family toxin n=1 Tax=Devosia sp. Leaf420 TaxID=1736374 RepID=UPI001FCCD2F1|nr:type II toxin-antitoxin system RelE/ParE family toxin [Devosia sp. Leaf420]